MYYVFIVNIPEEVHPYTHPGTHFEKQKNPQFGAKAAAAKRNSPERIQAFKNMALTPSNEPLFDEDSVRLHPCCQSCQYRSTCPRHQKCKRPRRR